MAGHLAGLVAGWDRDAAVGGLFAAPPSKSEQAQATHERVLPTGWESISDWQPVNVDDDKEEENLLLFRFDNGQVGALILDGDPATSISPPQYLFPRFFDDEGALGQGVIATPGTPASEITVTQVKGDKPTVELTILGEREKSDLCLVEWRRLWLWCDPTLCARRFWRRLGHLAQETRTDLVGGWLLSA